MLMYRAKCSVLERFALHLVTIHCLHPVLAKFGILGIFLHPCQKMTLTYCFYDK